ncbi:MAG: C10 family peptidase, partial [Syntrophothermus sp.]
MKNIIILCLSLITFLFPFTAHASITARFSVDLTKYVQTGVFKTGSDKVYLCGNFNNWEKNIEMLKDASGFVYRASIPVEKYTYYEYKYFITSSGAANGGFEDSVGAAGGRRYFNFWGFDKVLPVDYFNNEEPSSDHITITSPAAGESRPAGSVQIISWNVSGISNVKLEYTNDGGQTWQTLVTSIPASEGKYSWTLPDKISYEYRIRISDVSNPADVKYSSGLLVTYSNIAASVSPLLKIEYPVFQYPLNALYPPTIPTDDQIINGKVGNACGPTVVANILRFWEFPRKGTGSRSFTDVVGCQWSADFQATVYEYDRMPGNIPFNAPDSVYKAAALLMYHAGVGMHNAWRGGASDGIVEAMHEYFNYSKKSKFIERANYTPEQWDKIAKSELSAGRPLLSAGPGHWFVVDGYTADNLFHVRWDYGEANDQ